MYLSANVSPVFNAVIGVFLLKIEWCVSQKSDWAELFCAVTPWKYIEITTLYMYLFYMVNIINRNTLNFIY